MFKRILNLFHPIQSDDAGTQRHLLWWILLRMLLGSLLYGGAYFLQTKEVINSITLPVTYASLLLLLSYVFSVVSAFFLQRKKPESQTLWIFGLSQLCVDAFFIAVLVYGTGCSVSSFAPLFSLPVIAAGLILYRFGSLFLAAVCSFLYGSILLAEFYGYVPSYFFNHPYQPPTSLQEMSNLFAFYGLFFFLAAILSTLTGSRLHRTQKALHEREQAYDRLALLYRQIFNDISTGIITTDQENMINSYNQAAESITGYSAAQVLGRPLNAFFGALDGEATQPRRNVCDFVKKDGSTIRLGYSYTRLNLQNGENIEAKKESKAKVITIQDISLIERMEEQMREAEKLAAIGEMSAQVAHDFRNPLTAISGSAQMLATGLDCTNGERSAKTTNTLINIILRETERMEKTISDFLLFARPTEPDCAWFHLSIMTEECLALFRKRNEKYPQVVIQAKIDKELLCWADRHQLCKLMTELVENACAATAAIVQAGKVVIRARAVWSEEKDTLLLDVCDQGGGIPLEIRDQVFIPFFSRRPDGSGLGLAIVHQIARLHDGTVIIIEDEEYHSILRVSLPQPPQTNC